MEFIFQRLAQLMSSNDDEIETENTNEWSFTESIGLDQFGDNFDGDIEDINVFGMMEFH